VVTSAGGAELADLLREAAVANLFDLLVTSDDVDRSKPDPDLVQAALEKLAVGPREAVLIGDTPYDIASAARAGVSTIALRSGGWKDRDLQGAIAIYDHPADLLSRLNESPLAMGVDDVMPSSGVRRAGRRAATPPIR
jgi:phosphoglycolate phosphatase-like HAD superfamily hydrolase